MTTNRFILVLFEKKLILIASLCNFTNFTPITENKSKQTQTFIQACSLNAAQQLYLHNLEHHHENSDSLICLSLLLAFPA